MRPIRALKDFQRSHFSQWKPNCDGFYCVFPFLSVLHTLFYTFPSKTEQGDAPETGNHWEKYNISGLLEDKWFISLWGNKPNTFSCSKILNIFCLLSPCSAVNQSQFLNLAWRCLNKKKSPSQFGCVHFLHPPSVFHSLFFFFRNRSLHSLSHWTIYLFFGT